MSDSIVIPEGLLVQNTEEYARKVDSFVAGGAEELHVVFDFDRTLTCRHPGTNADINSWNILSEYLPKDGKRIHDKLLDYYYPLEVTGDMTDEMAVHWWSTILDLFVEHRLSLVDVEETFLERATIREGTREVFKLIEQQNIPSTILSAGVLDIIQIWIEKYGLQPTVIMATALQTNISGTVTGWDRDSLVHSLNKHEIDHPEPDLIRSRRNAIAIGDSFDDASMIEGDENALRIRLLHKVRDSEEERKRTFSRFDALIIDETLNPLRDILSQIMTRA